MQSQDQKLSTFIKAINEYAEKQRLSILSDSDEYTTEQLERAEKEAAGDACRMISRRTADARSDIMRSLAEKELGGRKQLFEQRCEIEKKVFSEAADRLRAFTKTNGYRDYLLRATGIVREAFDDDAQGTVFHLRAQDMALKNIIEEGFGAACDFCEDNRIELGGLLAVSQKLGKAVDMTFDSRLEQQREVFRAKAELPIL